MKLLLYCTKAKPYLYPHFNNLYFTKNKDFGNVKLNGKIVAECDFEVEKIEHYIHYEPEVDVGICVLPSFECSAYCTETLDHFKLLEKSCLKDYSLPNITVANELDDYLKGKNGYAIHIKNLHIFDKPKELGYTHLTRAPQNMMYCYGKNTGERYILISIRPEWLCKILNGEKTIEVRKKVLKEMLE